MIVVFVANVGKKQRLGKYFDNFVIKIMFVQDILPIFAPWMLLS